MDNSNKAIARRINKELRIRDWSQNDLLRKIIIFKNPKITSAELYIEVNKRKGNFSTMLKGKDERPFPKEDLYIIAKSFGVPLEYIWFGDEKKSGFVPKGARYAAFQDNDSAYRSYIADLENEDRVQHPDESGFNLFDYFGQFDSINGYKFFVKNYGLYFDYAHYGRLTYVNSEGYPQFCSNSERDYHTSDNLLMILVEHNDVKTFKAIFFDNCSLSRFDSSEYYGRNKQPLFSDNFLDMLLKNKDFFELIFKTAEVDISKFLRHYDKGEKRCFVEPLFLEALFYALKHEADFKAQLLKMLQFALEYNKSQLEFVKNYLKKHKDDEHSDVRIDEYDPRFLISSRNVPMGNIFKIRGEASDNELTQLLNEIEQYAFNVTHIINEQEKNNKEIKISTPDNPLFVEMCKNAIEQNAAFIPIVAHSTKEFTYFHYYESTQINYENPEHLKLIIDCLNKAQTLVSGKASKVLVHGNLDNTVLMVDNGKIIGLAGWQKCCYGSKYDDRAELLANIDYYYPIQDKDLENFKALFEIISQDFSQEEKFKLIDKAISLLNKRIDDALNEKRSGVAKAYHLKERASKLEFFKIIISR